MNDLPKTHMATNTRARSGLQVCLTPKLIFLLHYTLRVKLGAMGVIKV